MIAYASLVAVYLPEAKYFVPSWAVKRPGPSIETVINRSNLIGDLLSGAGQAASLQANSFYRGLDMYLMHNKLGHPSYLLGQYSNFGWWYYFPVVLLVKTPTADLLLFGVVLFGGLLVLLRKRFRVNWRRAEAAWATLIVPGVLYFAASMASNIDLGVRHLLPFYPFFFIAISTGFFALARIHWPRWSGPLAGLVCLLVMAESLAAYPDYLSFFNFVSGGTSQGPHYLVDSNIDWGQDLKKLKVYISTHPPSAYCLEYFGGADIHYYGIEYRILPRTHQVKEREDADCIGVIGATPLYDLYEVPGSFVWLRQMKPMDRVGGLWVFDLRKPHR